MCGFYFCYKRDQGNKSMKYQDDSRIVFGLTFIVTVLLICLTTLILTL